MINLNLHMEFPRDQYANRYHSGQIHTKLLAFTLSKNIVSPLCTS